MGKIDQEKLFADNINDVDNNPDAVEQQRLDAEAAAAAEASSSEAASSEAAAAEAARKAAESNNDISDEYFLELRNTLGEEFQIPEIIKNGVNEKGEKITAKEKLHILHKTLLDTTTFGATEEDDSFIRNYMRESSKENFDRKKFLDSYFGENNLLNLPPDKFMFEIYKKEYGVSDANADGMTDEEIKVLIEKKDPIELKAEAIRIKKDFSERQKRENENKTILYKKSFIENVLKQEESNKKNITSYIDIIKDSNNIGGFELGEADRQEFIKELPDFLEKKVYEKQNGELIAYSKAEELLSSLTSDPEKEMELIPILWMISKNKIKGYSTMLKEKAKETVESKLSNSKRQLDGSSNSFNNEINEDALFS